MVTRSRQTSRGLLALLATWAVGLPALLHYVGGREAHVGVAVHFWLVAFAALIAAAASIALTVGGARARDSRTVLLGAAFSTMTALLAIHGLATPGFIVGQNGVIALAGAASLPAGATVLALSALPAMRRPVSLRPVLALQAGLAVAILGLGAIGLLAPAAVPSVPQAGSAPAIVLLVIGAGGFALLAWRAARTYTLTRRTTDLLVSVGCVWLGWALVPQLLMGYGTWAFYFGHAMELLGIVLVAIPAVLDLRHGGGPSRPLVGDLAATELVGAEQAFLGARVRSLMVDLAAKDRSTEEHTRRVATLACAVGEELRLPPATLRHLAIGGLLHDMGKLRTPPGILCKPGALEPEEFALIQRHPEDGARLLAELGGFAPEVLDLVLDHHERLDGGGYPRGLEAPRIGLATRVLTVCDVYDALVSHRVYRPAWTVARALGLLRDERGSAFDPICVAALERVLTRNQDDPGWVTEFAREPASPRAPAPRR